MTRRLSIVIRCETAGEKGFGHFTRMLGLAQALKARHDSRVTFFCDSNGLIEKELERQGFPFTARVPEGCEETFVEQAARNADVLVLDKKWDYSAAFIRSLRHSRPVVLIDHCSPGMFEASLTIFPCAALATDVIEDSRWRDGPGVLLHGREFIPVSPRVLDLRHGRGVAWRARGPIVLTAGASDPRGVTLRLLPWIAKLDLDREIHVLIGEAFVHARELARLAERLPSHLRFFPFSQDRLAAAGIAVCTFGVTAYELMFLGVPALVIGHTRENALTSRILAERCAATIDLGYVGDLREQTFMMELSDLLRDPRKQREMSAKGLEQVDGLGAERMAQRIIGLAGERK